MTYTAVGERRGDTIQVRRHEPAVAQYRRAVPEKRIEKRFVEAVATKAIQEKRTKKERAEKEPEPEKGKVLDVIAH
uniref:Uncharacterized protein n=1 Tax=Setaria digitata TaxID=48799 RepID=A0A915PJ63_9BILA